MMSKIAAAATVASLMFLQGCCRGEECGYPGAPLIMTVRARSELDDRIRADKEAAAQAAHERESAAEQARQAAEERKRVADAAAAQSAASPRLLNFEKDMTSDWQTANLAYRASTCRLRSDAWLQTFMWAISIETTTQIQKQRFSQAEIAAIEEYRGKLLRTAFANTPCALLVNTPLMDQLDAIQWRLTGGYH